MTSHVGLMFLFALFTSVVFAALTKDQPAEQVRFGIRLLAGFVLGGILMGWLLHPLPL